MTYAQPVIEQFLCSLPDKKFIDKKNGLFHKFSNCITPQFECYRVNCITPMKEITAEIRVLYDVLLVQKKIPDKSRFYYKKWLRYYLDFCFKYGFNQSNKGSLSYFIKKLKEKNQTEQQQKQAFHAISIYFDIEFADKDKKIPLETKKRILSSKKEGLKSTNADWRPVYSALNAEIKLRHYSPKTFQSYRRWVKIRCQILICDLIYN